MFIATFCIENKIPLLHNDKDFGFIEKKLNLITIKQ
jgi:predicted nucleic acid-binding protein